MTSNTQLEQILDHLKPGKSITPIKVLELYGCFRFSAVILKLRKSGYEIVTHHERNKSDIGRHAHYELVKQVAV